MGSDMVEWILNASALILIVLLIRLIFQKRLTAKVRYGIWMLVLLRLLLPFSLFDSGFSLMSFIPRQEAEAGTQTEDSFGQPPTAQETTPPQFFTEWDQQSQTTVPETGGQTDNVFPDNRSEATDTPAWGTLLFSFWVVGMVVTFLAIAGSNLYFICRVRKSRQRLEGLQNKSPLPVYLSEAVPMPCMFGLLQPAVYVRKRDTDNREALAFILKHEYTHYRHRDNIWTFFRGLCLILHWYNPLVWIAAYCSKQDGELACDESVIRGFSAEESEEYGKVLISLSIQKTDYRTVLSCATTLGGGKGYLKERIRRIAEKPRLFVFSTAAAFLLGIAALLFSFAGVSAKPAEEDRSFIAGSPAETDSPIEAVSPTETGSPIEAERETTDGEPSDILSSADPVLAVTDKSLFLADNVLLINDYLVDMNGDGVKDILRVSSADEKYALMEEPLTGKEALREAVEKIGTNYQISLYDGARAADMHTFKTGDPLKEEARIAVFDLAQQHVGNGQYSYYEEDGRGYLICNSPYLSQGMASYSYEVWTYTDTWEETVVDEDFLSFSILPQPQENEKNPAYGMEENFPIEDMIHYTMELKRHLDKSAILMDTSVYGKVLFTTHYENNRIRPDAFAIWYWDDIFISVDSEETLREALTEMGETML